MFCGASIVQACSGGVKKVNVQLPKRGDCEHKRKRGDDNSGDSPCRSR
jgi:hypothetical protein